MRHLLALWCLIILAAPAFGNSDVPPDDMGRFLEEKGLAPTPVLPAETTAAPTEDPVPGTSQLVVAAMGALGVPYKYGGNTFNSGFDCSGFVRAMYKQFMGILLPRRAADQAAATRSIDLNQLRPGDLVFFNTLRAFSHVGIYVGDHKFIHSPRTGAVVRIEDMRVGYWSRRFDGARRVIGATDVPPTEAQRAQAALSDVPGL